MKKQYIVTLTEEERRIHRLSDIFRLSITPNPPASAPAPSLVPGGHCSNA